MENINSQAAGESHRVGLPTKTTAGEPKYTRCFSWVTCGASTDGNGRKVYQVVLSCTNTLGGDAGNDLIRAVSGNDIVHGGADNDDTFDLASDEVLFHGTGHDTPVGGREDRLYGSAGDDVPWGDDEVEQLPFQYDGDDRLDGGESTSEMPRKFERLRVHRVANDSGWRNVA